MKNHLLILIFALCSLSCFCQIEYHNVAPQKGINHTYGFGAPGGGVSFVDFDNDGWDDITMATEEGEEIYFYKNINGTFQKIPAIIDHTEESKQVLWVDFDNDDDLDLYVTTYGGPNRLYRNIGNLEMEDITEDAGFPIDSLWHYGACWGDFDRDGWLDVYYNERKTLTTGTINRNRLFRNNANGTFTEVTYDAQVADENKLPFCSAFFDYNNDKWADLYTANDKFFTNTLLKNNGNGTFTDVSIPTQSNIAINAMCVAIGDYDNDALQDIYVTNLPLGNALLKNTEFSGIHLFTDEAATAGVGFYAISWGANFLDGNNDGWQDLYVSGMEVGTDVVSAAFYKNEMDGTFSQDVIGFEGDTTQSYVNAIGDFNQDGYPDIMVSNFQPFTSQLWENAGGTNNWIKVKLNGVLSNRNGVGSKIEIFSNGFTQTRYTHCGIGYLAQNSNEELIGIGTSTQVDSIFITWTSGHVDKLYNEDANQILNVTEGSTTNGDINVDDDVTITPPPPPEAVENLEENYFSMNIAPNPVDEVLRIFFNKKNKTDGELIVYDLLGKIHKRIPVKKWEVEKELNIKHLDDGVYILNYRSEEYFVSKTVFKTDK